MIENLNLKKYTDRETLPVKTIDDILQQVIFRTYTASGIGGLFPLKSPRDDQRRVELWYQLCSYLLEED